MKLQDVPQDPKDFKEGYKLRKLVYATDNSGKYTGAVSAGWTPENVAMKQAWEIVDEDLINTLHEIQSGTASPIKWFMKKSLMDEVILSKYVRKFVWQVKRHLQPDGFAKLSQKSLDAYAKAFDIDKDRLLNFDASAEQATVEK